MLNHSTGYTSTFSGASWSQPSYIPRKSVVQVYFPHREMSWSYYNDSFDLKVGDFVYVEGKLEGFMGRVTEINYSFKIKLSDYKKVIALVDTSVKGDFYLAGSHLVTFDKNAIPQKKVLTWFKAPQNNEEYVSGDDNTERFPLDDPGKMKISHDVAERGHEYFIENRVSYLCLDGTQGYAIVEGTEPYEVEFTYSDGELGNLKCTCFCNYNCKHEFAAILQLRETLDFVLTNYKNRYTTYFAAISKNVFVKTVMNKTGSGKISLEV